MKPFPDNVPVAVPVGCYAERPWWRYTAAKGSPPSPRKFHRWDGQVADTDEEAAEIDRKHPILEPRFLSGQVWLLDALQAAVVVTITTCVWSPPRKEPRFWGDLPDPDDHFSAMGKPVFQVPAPLFKPGSGFARVGSSGYLINGRMLNQYDGESLLRSAHPDWDAYLIFDPCNPQRGIWTAAKEK